MSTYPICAELQADLRKNERVWREIDEELWEWMLGCVPPIRQRGNCFMNSEPYTHLPDGRAVYFTSICHDEKFFAVYATTSEWDSGLLHFNQELPKLSSPSK